jgi:hypothetical protein
MKESLTFRNLVAIVITLSVTTISQAQANPKLAGKQFYQVYMHQPGKMEAHLRFDSENKATYIMNGTLTISGAKFRDECPCTVKMVSGNISIKCICSDKEIYPDPIEDSFTYNDKTKVLTSTRYKDNKAKEFITW